jgi:hypothetical protein
MAPEPMAVEVPADAATALAPVPIAMAPVPVAVPPPAWYCACATFRPTPPSSTANATAWLMADLLRLPRAAVFSEVATQAPSDSFQMER